MTLTELDSVTKQSISQRSKAIPLEGSKVHRGEFFLFLLLNDYNEYKDYIQPKHE